jgi:AcrR family transcriptional regulator
MNKSSPERRRGRRPADAEQRRATVVQAISELEESRVPFSMADVADRAGISRATLYRDAALRALIGNRGDGPETRPVNFRDVEKLKARITELERVRRELRRTVREAEEKADISETRARDFERRLNAALSDAVQDRAEREAFEEGFAAGQKAAQNRPVSGRGTASSDMMGIAAKMPRESLLNARRTLARVLHPDLFASDPAAAILATEILKQLNAVAGMHR